MQFGLPIYSPRCVQYLPYFFVMVILRYDIGMPSEFLPSKNEAFKLVYTYNKNAIYMCLRSANLFVCKDTTFFQNTIKNNVIRNDIMPGE